MKLRYLGLLLVIAVALSGSVSVLAQDGGSVSEIGLELVAEGLTAPVNLESPHDGSGRLFVVEQPGTIRVIDADDQLLDEPFLDIQDRIVELNQGYDEQGLLGLAFHPDYASNGRFFVYYSAPLQENAPAEWANTSVVAEYTMSDPSANVADAGTERVLLTVDQPQSNHNGGDITFGPDGYLYIPLGDGGAANDQAMGHTEDIGNAQDTTNLLGSILRIDVDNGDAYAIPDDNPFAGDDTMRGEIWAWGLRNPWTIAFDAAGDNDLFVADAGQNLWEEVSIVSGGNNYGWHIMEGYHCFDPDNPTFSPLTCEDTGANGDPLHRPIIEYSHKVGLVVVGGYVYRGSAMPNAFQGHYFFADWSTSFASPDGKILIAGPPPEGVEDAMWETQVLSIAGRDNGELGAYVLAFGQDENNEVYVLTSQTAGPTGETGSVWRIVSPE
ncbi:MAG: hypothetical protein CL610_29850 [Anaerolineaceae bacterium]|nr:hypothetical protein [Anaerolineaceae bacterium]